MRILVTNDDGIDTPGIGALAAAVAELGEVVVIAPNREFSGASAAIGAIYRGAPTVERREFAGGLEAWAVDGPPALGVFYASNGVFGEPFDLVVSGINPGANTGRSVYYSGTVGACVAARNAGWSGVAVSQHVSYGSIEGQAFEDLLVNQKWHVAAEVGAVFVAALLADLPTIPVIANINVPNLELDEIVGWDLTEVADVAFGSTQSGGLEPIDGMPGHFDVKLSWERQATEPPVSTDVGAVNNAIVAVSYLSPVTHQVGRTDLESAETALSKLVSRLDAD
ncbi:MAG TPA: 5'/3'-nucleotidase SurE [Ilumatobacter sp.]|nr:5'/3'-nucleotidase SurE [Ilumatobacter sp.]